MAHPSVGSRSKDEADDTSAASSSPDDVQPDNPMSVLLGSGETHGRLAVIETLELQGCGPPLHIHNNEDEVVYVLDGEVTFVVDGRRIDARKGTCVLLRRGQEHCYAVESARARLLVLLTPGGLDSYYRELSPVSRGSSATPYGGLDAEWLVTVAARYGIEITGPRPGIGAY